jgi:hypothetical protein
LRWREWRAKGNLRKSWYYICLTGFVETPGGYLGPLSPTVPPPKGTVERKFPGAVLLGS